MTADIRTPAEEDRPQLVELLRASLNFTRAWAEDRGRGLAGAVVLRVLREARHDGMSVSALFPAVLRPYRRLGYELGGTYCEHRLALDAIPSDLGDRLPAVELLDPERDLDGLRACYREWSRHGNGPLEPTSDGATRALLAYFRSFRGVGIWVQWCGPPEDSIAMLVPEQGIMSPFRFRWMFRLLDVRSALAERGYPAIDADVVVAVADPQFPENAGPWRLVVRAGEASVEPAPGAGVRPLPIGILSTLFSGFLRVPDAVRLGYLDRNDPAVPALQQLLAGSDPWCPFFF